MEADLLRRVTEVRSDRAGVPRMAAGVEACRLVCSDMGGASCNVVAVAGEGANRASRKARLFDAGFARAGVIASRRQFEALVEHQGGAIGVPKAEFRMDEDAERGGITFSARCAQRWNGGCGASNG